MQPDLLLRHLFSIPRTWVFTKTCLVHGLEIRRAKGQGEGEPRSAASEAMVGHPDVVLNNQNVARLGLGLGFRV